MAILKATPKTFAEALLALKGRDERKIGNNTSLRVVQECNWKTCSYRGAPALYRHREILRRWHRNVAHWRLSLRHH